MARGAARVSAAHHGDRYFFFLAAGFAFVREAALVGLVFFGADFTDLAAGLEGFAPFFAGAGAAFLAACRMRHMRRMRGMHVLLGRLRHDLRNIGNPRSRRLRPLRVRFLGLAHQFVRLFLRHLSATYHVLHEIACAFDGEASEAGSCTDDVFHRRGNFAPRLLTDFLRTRRHFGDRVSHISASVSRGTTRSHRSGRRSGVEGSG